MKKTLHYLFDPLCGWCYGASAAVEALAGAAAVRLHLLPSGLFADEGARPMDPAFADYAWANDQRIARLTGQPFSNRYRHTVLADHQQLFDSGPATVALTAVVLTVPGQEVAALKIIQHARYVDGRNIADSSVLASILQDMGLEDAADLLRTPTDLLLAANRSRVLQARRLMQATGTRGVPAFLLEDGDQYLSLPTSTAFTSPDQFLAQLFHTSTRSLA